MSLSPTEKAMKNKDQSELANEEKILLKQFRSAVIDILKPEHDDRFLERFLISRDYDVKKAEKMIRESFKFKKKIEAEDLLNSGYELPELAKTYLFTKFIGFDKDGNPVRSFLGGICDYKGFSYSVTIVDKIKAVMYLLEGDYQKALRRSEETGHFRDQTVFLIDLSNFNVRQFCDKTVIQAGIQILTMYQDNYPELLKVAYLVNAPPYFMWVLNIFKPFIHERTMRKLKICKTDSWKSEILSSIDRKILPKYYGGDKDDPDSDPNIRILSNTGSKIPLKYYQKNGMSLSPSDPGIIVVSIKERSVYDHKMNVEVPGTIMKWVFQTKDYNVKFGVLFRSQSSMNSKKSQPDELVHMEVVESHLMPERGELVCEKIGQYILHFDNSYSWLTSKQLLYKVEQMPPKQRIISQ